MCELDMFMRTVIHNPVDIVSICTQIDQFSMPINEIYNEYNYPIIHLLIANHIRDGLILDLLIHKGMDINIKNGMGESPLVYAARINDTHYCKMLVERKADIDSYDLNEDSPLLWATHHNNVTLVKLFLDYGANFSHKYRDGNTAIMWAAKQSNEEVFLYLLEHLCNVNETNNENLTIMDISTSRCKVQLSKWLKRNRRYLIILFSTHNHSNWLEPKLIHMIWEYYTNLNTMLNADM